MQVRTVSFSCITFSGIKNQCIARNLWSHLIGSIAIFLVNHRLFNLKSSENADN